MVSRGRDPVSVQQIALEFVVTGEEERLRAIACFMGWAWGQTRALDTGRKAPRPRSRCSGCGQPWRLAGQPVSVPGLLSVPTENGAAPCSGSPRSLLPGTVFYSQDDAFPIIFCI